MTRSLIDGSMGIVVDVAVNQSRMNVRFPPIRLDRSSNERRCKEVCPSQGQAECPAPLRYCQIILAICSARIVDKLASPRS